MVLLNGSSSSRRLITLPSSVSKLHSSVTNCRGKKSANAPFFRNGKDKVHTESGQIAERKQRTAYITTPRPPETSKSHISICPPPLDAEANINPAMKLVQLAPDPREPVPEVNLLAEDLARFLARAQCIQRGVDDGRGRLLVVEDGERADGYESNEERDSAEPAQRW